MVLVKYTTGFDTALQKHTTLERTLREMGQPTVVEKIFPSKWRLTWIHTAVSAGRTYAAVAKELLVGPFFPNETRDIVGFEAVDR